MTSAIYTPSKKNGTEHFRISNTSTDINLTDFWSWAYSDLVNNTERGKLAEYIVASALGIASDIAATWDSYDLRFMNKGIEVKSSSYLQSWHQERESSIIFGSRPTYALNATTGKYDTEKKRQADLYVFCLLSHKDKATLNPLDLDQWEFYIVPTSMLNRLAPTSQSTSLKFLQKHEIHPCRYSEILSNVEQLITVL